MATLTLWWCNVFFPAEPHRRQRHVDCFYIALFSALEHSLRLHVILQEWLVFQSAFLNIHRSGVLTALTWLVPHETTAILAQVLCTPYSRAPCHFMQSHIPRVHACLVVTCHLHFWQIDWDLLRATALTQGLNRYRNKSQHRKLTLEKKILPPVLRGLKPVTFQSRVWHSNHWAIPAPRMLQLLIIIIFNALVFKKKFFLMYWFQFSSCCELEATAV